MAISRILGASLVSDLDRQGVDLQLTTSGNALVYMDFASFRLGVGTSSPTHDLTVPGQAKLANLIFTNDLITSETGTIDFGSNANIKISGGATNSVLTTDGSGNLFWAESLGNVIFTGNSSFSVINANLIYEDSYRVLTTNSNIQINGDAIGSGTSSNIYVALSNTGVVAGTYGSADDEYTDRVPKITVDSKGRITNIANVTLTQVGNVSFIDTTISTIGNLTLAPSGGVIYANTSIIKNLSNPVDNQDAVTLSYLNSALATSATGIAKDNTAVAITDDGVNAAVITTTIDGTVVANVYGGVTEFYTTVNIGNLSIDDRTITSNGNIILDALGTGTVQFTGTDAVGLPSGGDATRPANPEIGYLRFNTDRDAIEYWTGNVWEVPGESYISSEIINPDGVGNTFVMTSASAADSMLVSINGTMQQPYTAYNVSGYNITFTEVPEATDKIEIRHIALGSGVTVTSLVLGNISVSLDTANVNVVGNLHLSQPLAVQYGGTGGANANVALQNLMPPTTNYGYVLTTDGAGTYYWAEGTPGPAGTFDTSYESLAQNMSAYPYNINRTGSTIANVTYTVAGNTIVKEFTYNGSGQIESIAIHGVPLGSTVYTKNLTYSGTSVSSVSYSIL